eukprot:12669246-Ditylum_brightwellii.AAC.1
MAKVARQDRVMQEKMGGASKPKKHKLMRSMETGAWLTLKSDRMNRTDIEEEEFRDHMRLWYGQRPLHLQE